MSKIVDKQKEVKTPWVLFGASNGGHSIEYKIFAPTHKK